MVTLMFVFVEVDGADGALGVAAALTSTSDESVP